MLYISKEYKTCIYTMEVKQTTEQKGKSKYQAQIDYDKKRRESDEEYRKKKNEQARLRNKERYANDIEYRNKVREMAKLREAKIREFYKTHKDLVSVN